VTVHHVGTVTIKHSLYARISADGDKPPEARLIHLSDELPPEFFSGLVSEIYNPTKNRFEKRTGVRNEPLDTWVYAHAAAHHPELRLHRRSKADWDAAEARLGCVVASQAQQQPQQNIQVQNVPREAPRPLPEPMDSDLSSSAWSRRL